MLTPEEKMNIIKNSLQDGYKGSINKMINETEEQAFGVDEVARTPKEQEQGLRGKPPGTSMAFPDSTGNFNTKGMDGPINIKKMDKKGNVVRSYNNVPPGIENLPMGEDVGTVIETPGTYQDGGLKNDLSEQKPGNKHSGEFKQFLEDTENRMAKAEQEFHDNREKRLSDPAFLMHQNGGYKQEQFENEMNTNYQESQNPIRARSSRENVKQNPDGSHSTHLMAHDPDTLEAWPTLFQNNETGKWYQLQPDRAKFEAKLRNEIYKFDTQQEVYDFSVLGNWKKQIGLNNLKMFEDTYLKNLNFMYEEAPKNKQKLSYISKQGWGGVKKHQTGSFADSTSLWDKIKSQMNSSLNLNTTGIEGTGKEVLKHLAVGGDDESNANRILLDGNNLENSIYISDKRKIRGIDNEDIVPTRDLKSGKYNKDLITAIISRAKYYNLPPELAIAIAMQEGNLGKSDMNLGHVLGSSEKLATLEKKGMSIIPEKHNNAFRFSYIPYMASIWNRHNPNSGIEGAADVNDGEEYTIQRYNGLGHIYQNTEADYHGGNVKAFYGVKVPPNVLYTENDVIPEGKKVGDVKQKGSINMKKEKLYGKQIIDIRDNIINNNQDLLDLIKETPAYVIPEEK